MSQSLEHMIKITQERVDDINRIREAAIEELNKLTQKVKVEDLDFLVSPLKYVDYHTKKGIYKYILGGDGRSAPWDEQRTGIILTITVKDEYYLTRYQLESIEAIAGKLTDHDHLIINK